MARYFHVKEGESAEGGSGYVIEESGKAHLIASDAPQAIFHVAKLLGFDVDLGKCYDLLQVGRRAAVEATKRKRAEKSAS